MLVSHQRNVRRGMKIVKVGSKQVKLEVYLGLLL